MCNNGLAKNIFCFADQKQKWWKNRQTQLVLEAAKFLVFKET